MEWDKMERKECPSCMRVKDTSAHVLVCHHEGMVETLHNSLSLMEEWMREVDTKPELQESIAEYAHADEGLIMGEILKGRGETFQQMAHNQDEIGWRRRFMEGIICTRMREMQQHYRLRLGFGAKPERWAQGLILKLMETTHGQWL